MWVFARVCKALFFVFVFPNMGQSFSLPYHMGRTWAASRYSLVPRTWRSLAIFCQVQSCIRRTFHENLCLYGLCSVSCQGKSGDFFFCAPSNSFCLPSSMGRVLSPLQGSAVGTKEEKPITSKRFQGLESFSVPTNLPLALLWVSLSLLALVQLGLFYRSLNISRQPVVLFPSGLLRSTVTDSLQFFSSLFAGLKCSGFSVLWFDSLAVYLLMFELCELNPPFSVLFFRLQLCCKFEWGKHARGLGRYKRSIHSVSVDGAGASGPDLQVHHFKYPYTLQPPHPHQESIWFCWFLLLPWWAPEIQFLWVFFCSFQWG